MKPINIYKVIAVLGLLLMSVSASAQSYLLDNPNNRGYFGIRGSYNLSLPTKVKSKTISGATADTKKKVFGKGSGFNLGIIYNQPLVANFYIEPGLTLAYSTESFKHTMDMFPAFFDKEMKHSSARKLSIQLPVVVGYHFDFTPDISLAVSTGPVLKVGLSDDYYMTTTAGTHVSGSLYGESGTLRRVDCAWRFGVGFNIATRYYVGVSGDLGLLDLLKVPDHSMYENAFSVSVGYNF